MDIYRNALHDVLTESGFIGFTINPEENNPDTVEIVSTIGLTGELQGYLILRSDLESAKMFADSLANSLGIASDEPAGSPFGKFHKEVIGEITNQIAGRAIMLLANNGYDCNLTPPTIIVGDQIFTDMVNFDQFHTYSIVGAFGKINLFVGLKTAKI